MKSEPLKTEAETEINISEIDSKDFAKLDREALEKIAASLSQRHDAITKENRDRQVEVARLQFEVDDDSRKLPQIAYLTQAAQKAIDKLEVESNLIEDVKNLRPMCDRVNSLSKQLYDELTEYLSEVDRIKVLQKDVDSKAQFLSKVAPGDLPTIEHREGFERFELKTVDTSAYQRQNRSSAFQDVDFGFNDHQYRAKN